MFPLEVHILINLYWLRVVKIRENWRDKLNKGCKEKIHWLTKKKKNHHSALKFKQNTFCRKKKKSSCDYIKENKSLETRKAYAVLKSFTCTDIEFLKLDWINWTSTSVKVKTDMQQERFLYPTEMETFFFFFFLFLFLFYFYNFK